VPVTVDGSTVGAVVVTYPARNPAELAALAARDVIFGRLALAAALALVMAAVVSAFVARRIARPVTALTAAADAIERGERQLLLPARAPGELGRLARTFARMATGLAAAEQARRAVVADVAHELRTPVTILRGNLEGMVDGATAATPEALQSLHDEVLKLGRILDDLAALAAADAAALRLHRTSLDLARVADQVVGVLAPTAADAGVRLTTSLVPTLVVGDETRLHQVLLNLVGNAVKFSPDGGTVSVCVRGHDGDAEVTVSDNGPGIPPEELPHVFERFWRADRGAGTSGSGIGLAVVKQLVEAHGGTVQVSSTPSEGARFVVSLPAHSAGHTAAPPRGET
jgi:two-component system sensor histidine kinase BaeS